jgi:hypothetical protein
MRAVTADVFRAANDSSAARNTEEQCDLAIQWLEKAMDAGFRPSAPLEANADFHALIERDDFKRIVRQLPTQPRSPKNES